MKDEYKKQIQDFIEFAANALNIPLEQITIVYVKKKQ